MKYVLIALLLLSAQADAATRRLAECDPFPATPTEAEPFDLDLCPLKDGDNITQLLKDIQAKWPQGFFLRAPSRSLTVISDSIEWPSSTKDYAFFEDQDPANELTIQHAAEPKDFWTLWRFENFDRVRIGGPNLSITFKGNHPGLANCDEQYPRLIALGYPKQVAEICDVNKGLIEFRMSDGSEASLAEVSANIRYSQSYSIYTWGSPGFAEDVGAGNKIQQLKVAGLHFATSGVFFHQGVRHAWADPKQFVVSDPYVRIWGWTGEKSSAVDHGLPVGCPDKVRDQVRANSFTGYYTDSIKGGVTIEYGSLSWIPRYATQVGNSAEDPFVVRIRDWGISGPGTPYPEGVRVKKTGEAILFKGDPHYKGEPGVPQRFVRFERLPGRFGSGPSADTAKDCAYSFADGPSNIARLENSTSFPNRDWHITFSGDWRTPSQGGSFRRRELLRFAWDGGESYGHKVRAAAGTKILETLRMYDRGTISGPGEFHDVSVESYSAAVPGRGNLIADTHVAGKVRVNASTGTTTIRNVSFGGARRTIIEVESGSKVLASSLCAASGSVISGKGTVILDGKVAPLPYVISDANGCSVPEPLTVITPPTGLQVY